MECKKCFQTLQPGQTVCPNCGASVEVDAEQKILTVEEVKAKWRYDISRKEWLVQPSLNELHKAERMAMGMGMSPQLGMSQGMGMGMQPQFGMNPMNASPIQPAPTPQKSSETKQRDLAALFKMMKQNQALN